MAEQDKLQTGKAESSTPAEAGANADAKPVQEPGTLSAAAAAAAAKIEASMVVARAQAAAAKEAAAEEAAKAASAKDVAAKATADKEAAAKAAAAKAATDKEAAAKAAADKEATAKAAAAKATAAKVAAAKATQPQTKAPVAPAATTATSAATPAPKTPAAPGSAPVASATPAAKVDASAAQPAAAPTVVPAKPAEKPQVKEVTEPEEIEDIIAKIPVEPPPATTKVAVTEKPRAAHSSGPAEQNADATTVLPRPTSAEPKVKAAEQTASAVAEARSRVFGAYTPVPEPTPAARERRSRREAALEAKPPLARTLQVLLAICYPFLLLIVVIRLIASPIFLWIAYQRPGFPADSFGFSTADRLNYGSFGVDFLNNVADNRYLGELRDINGNPLFLATEVQHMADVKHVMSLTYLAGAILGVIVLFALIYLGKRYSGGTRRGLFAGSIATIVLLAGLVTVAVMGWETFFTSFHKIFFANGTWTFNYSDTLIRLYPPQFWVDAAIGIAGLVLITSIITLIATWPTAKRRELARLRQEKRVFGL
ncbi:TIGR01906 family membrane protein [Arthrobacter sp. 7749]|nr:TIGR01906 family membrane protein [Arthrobacter sp. 7749]